MNAKRIACKAAKTFAVFLISVLVLSLLVFVVSRLAPGDPLVSFYGERAEKLKPAERGRRSKTRSRPADSAAVRPLAEGSASRRVRYLV